VIEVLRSEVTRNLILMGCPSVQALDRTWISPAPHADGKETT
jgi:isopentenyl diphosphate isomerase/L-lactate dehydrogenase-like FMN-dependent dehydrogenase